MYPIGPYPRLCLPQQTINALHPNHLTPLPQRPHKRRQDLAMGYYLTYVVVGKLLDSDPVIALTAKAGALHTAR